jgi:hypothetical protein
VRNLAGRHFEENEMIAGGEAIGVRVVNLKLTVRIFMINLLDIDTSRTKRDREPLKKYPGPRQALVVVTGLGQGVTRITRLDLPLSIATQERKLWFETREERPPMGSQAINLSAQQNTTIEWPRLTVHMALANDPCKPRLPGHERDRAQVPNGHEIGAVRLNANAPDCKSGEASAVGQDGLEVGNRHRLGLGDAVDIDKLRQHMANALRAQVRLSRIDRPKFQGLRQSSTHLCQSAQQRISSHRRLQKVKLVEFDSRFGSPITEFDVS